MAGCLFRGATGPGAWRRQVAWREYCPPLIPCRLIRAGGPVLRAPRPLTIPVEHDNG
jgi:hypothetical protein